MYARDFRERARMALQNNWPWAVLTGFVASLLGASPTMRDGGGVSSDSVEQLLEDLESAGVNMTALLTNPIVQLVLIFVGIMLLVSFVYAIVLIVIGGPITLGYAKYNLK